MTKASGLRARRIDGPLIDGDRRMVYFLLAPQRWSFRSSTEREELISAAATVYGQLVGRRIHLRVTNRHYPADQWAQGLDENTPDPLPGWREHLLAEQAHVRSLRLADKQVYLGVEMHTPWLRHKAMQDEIREVARIVAGYGVEGRLATPEQMEFLLHRSVALGSPAPVTLPPPMYEWNEDDTLGFAEKAQWSAHPYARSVRIVAAVNDRLYERFVVTLTVARMETLSIPEQMGPWMQQADRLGYPVEWSVIADVLEPSVVKRRVRDTMQTIQHQTEHYLEHKLNPPLSLQRQNKQALAVEDQVASTDLRQHRLDAWVRVAVSGSTEQQALDRAKEMAGLYAPSITLEATFAQYAVGREFIPGERLSSTAHRRQLPAMTFAAGLPNVTALVGDRVGIHIGSTGTSAVCWEPHRSMEVRERSGLTLVTGEPGAGKSTLIGALIYQEVERGVRTVALDPSGPMARLCEMPQLAPYSRSVDLMNAEPGALSPFRVIADPPLDHFADMAEWNRARLLADARRRTLCMDIMLMLLPASVARLPETRMVLKAASRAVGGGQHNSARNIINALRKDETGLAEQARYIADELDDMAEMPQAQLIFAPGDDLDPIGYNRYLLQVLTMRGNVLPKEGTPPDDWQVEERLGLPLLHLAAHLTIEHVYAGSMHIRKLLVMDEVHELSRIAPGRSLVSRVSRDSRKWNLRALLSSQNMDDLTVAGISNFVDSAFVGRTEDWQAQQDCLRMLRVPLGVGYEQVLGRLSPIERMADRRSGFREFIFRDGDGGIEKIRVHVPDAARDALDTTADPGRA